MFKLHIIAIVGIVVAVVVIAFIGKGLDRTPNTPTPILKPLNPVEPQPPSSSVLHIYEQAAVCSDSNACSEIGNQILQNGGTAVDAAIAALFCNGLVGMQSMGLGGGFLMTVYDQNKRESTSILAREIAPLTVNADAFAPLANSSKLFLSSLSIAVPTEIMGYAVAHERFGKLAWTKLVEPTIEICYAGYTLTKHQRDALQTNKGMVFKDNLLRRIFVNDETHDFHRAGTLIKPPHELCRTLEDLAANGPRSFYTGKLAENIVADLQDIGSPIREHDLINVRAPAVPAWVVPLGTFNLNLTPPPGSGYIVGLVMNILNTFRQDFVNTKTMDGLRIHRIAEALKLAFVKRWALDTHMDQELLANITCPVYAGELAKLINDALTHDQVEYYGAGPDVTVHPDHGTAHISVLAANGDAVAVTSSINFYFGSGHMGSRTGVLFNNAMSDFSIDGLPNYFQLPNVKHKNRIKASSSPMSSMSPVIVTDGDGRVRLVVGAAGGSRIISILTQILVRILWLEENVKEAIDAARFHHQLLPNVLEYEYGILESTIATLTKKGHATRRNRVGGSAVCGIERVDGAVYANADYRKEGGVAGY